MWPSHVDRRRLDAGALLTADGTDDDKIKLDERAEGLQAQPGRRRRHALHRRRAAPPTE